MGNNCAKLITLNCLITIYRILGEKKNLCIFAWRGSRKRKLKKCDFFVQNKKTASDDVLWLIFILFLFLPNFKTEIETSSLFLRKENVVRERHAYTWLFDFFIWWLHCLLIFHPLFALGNRIELKSAQPAGSLGGGGRRGRGNGGGSVVVVEWLILM